MPRLRPDVFAALVVVSVLLGKAMPLWSMETGPAAGSLHCRNGVAEAAESKTDYVQMDFQGVDIRVFIKAVGEITGKDFVVSPKVTGEVSVVAPTKIPVHEAYEVFQSVLEVHGFTAVPAGRIVKIVPSSEARGKGIDTHLVR